MKGKKIIIAALAAFMLAGCADNTVVEENPASVESSSATSVAEDIVTSSTESKPAESSSTTSSVESKPEEKPAESSSTSSVESKPEEKPAESSSTTSTESKPVEKPIESKPTHTHKFSKATCEKPATCECGATKGNALGHNFTNATCNKLATCTTCGVTKGTLANHNYIDGICTICGKNDPNYKAPHNCDIDGHIWVDNGTTTSTESVEIEETHDVSACGYDFTLANRYFGRKIEDINFADYLGTVYGSGSTSVKTTGTKTITTFYHKCTECGVNEVYNTEETVTLGDTWEFVYGPRSEFYPVVWYDINNIPTEILEGRERDKIAEEEFWDTF